MEGQIDIKPAKSLEDKLPNNCRPILFDGMYVCYSCPPPDCEHVDYRQVYKFAKLQGTYRGCKKGMEASRFKNILYR